MNLRHKLQVALRHVLLNFTVIKHDLQLISRLEILLFVNND